jgi:hypothetical protein
MEDLVIQLRMPPRPLSFGEGVGTGASLHHCSRAVKDREFDESVQCDGGVTYLESSQQAPQGHGRVTVDDETPGTDVVSKLYLFIGIKRSQAHGAVPSIAHAPPFSTRLDWLTACPSIRVGSDVTFRLDGFFRSVVLAGSSELLDLLSVDPYEPDDENDEGDGSSDGPEDPELGGYD